MAGSVLLLTLILKTFVLQVNQVINTYSYLSCNFHLNFYFVFGKYSMFNLFVSLHDVLSLPVTNINKLSD